MLQDVPGGSAATTEPSPPLSAYRPALSLTVARKYIHVFHYRSPFLVILSLSPSLTHTHTISPFKLGQQFLGTSLWEPDSTAVWNGDMSGPTDSHSGLECGCETGFAFFGFIFSFFKLD